MLPAPPRVELHDRWLRLHFAAPHAPADFHYVWLRHQCDHDRHPLTRERTLDPSEIAPDLRARSARVDADRGVLRVEWEGEPASRPASEYPLAWLTQHAYGARPDAAPPPSNVAAVTLAASRYGDASALARAALELVASAGLAVVRGFLPGQRNDASPADTEELIRGFESRGLHTVGTHFGRIEDLRTDNTTNQNTDQLGYTDAGIQLHTDQPFLAEPPRYQMLHALRAADEGGDNFLVDARAAADLLARTDPGAFALLCSVPVRFHRKQKAFERVLVSPLLSYGAGAPPRFRVRYSYFTMAPFDLPFGAMEAWYRAYASFARVVREPSHQYRFRLEPGDLVLYDNHRMLHARTAFRGPRWLRGVYFDEAGEG